MPASELYTVENEYQFKKTARARHGVYTFNFTSSEAEFKAMWPCLKNNKKENTIDVQRFFYFGQRCL